MPTTNDYAALSASVYDNSGAPPGWTRISELSNSDTGFYGAAFQNANGDIVIASRGLEPTDGGDWQFVHEILPPPLGLGQVPAQLADAQALYQQVIHDFNPSPDKLSFTGHSEGGALSEMMTYTTGLYSETFGAPGVAHLLDQLTPSPTGGLDNALNHVIRTDPIGITGTHVGAVVYDAHYPDPLEVLACVRGGPYTCLGLFLYNSHAIVTYRALFALAPQTGSPIILDLDGDGVETIGVTAGPNFDHDGNGFAEQTGWVKADDGLLVRDLNGNGLIEDGKELFGNETLLSNNTKAANGYEALAELDSNADGKIDFNDPAYGHLRIWRDTNGDGVSESDELFALPDQGVASICTGFTTSNFIDANGNEHRQVSTFTRTDSTTDATADVWFKLDKTFTIATDWLDVPAEIAALPDAQGFGNVYDLHRSSRES